MVVNYLFPGLPILISYKGMKHDHMLIFHSLVAYLLSGIKMGSAGNVRSCNTYEVAILTCGRERG